MERAPTIYFAQAGQDGPIKIGFTASSPTERLAVLQTGCPWPIKLIGSMPGSTIDESRFHKSFADLRICGEWFSPAERLLTAIDNVLNGNFVWPVQEDRQRAFAAMPLSDNPSISEIIRAAGGVNRIAAASRGQISIDAVHKWRRNGIRDWHWALMMSLCDVTVDQLYRANEDLRAASINLKVA